MTKVNLSKCPNCKLGLISEEVPNHKCMKITDYWIIDGIIWLGDGKRYYQFKQHPKLNKENFNDKHPDSEQNLISKHLLFEHEKFGL